MKEGLSDTQNEQIESILKNHKVPIKYKESCFKDRFEQLYRVSKPECRWLIKSNKNTIKKTEAYLKANDKKIKVIDINDYISQK